MKVAYVFAHPRAASYKLGRMILPQLEAGTHGVEVVGMFFFDDNTFVLRQGDPIGERLAKVAADKGMLLMMCDMCALVRRRRHRPHRAGRDRRHRHRARRGGRLLPRPLRGAGGEYAGSGDYAVTACLASS